MANISALIHGEKPHVAGFIPTDPIAMLRQLLGGEIQDWPQITQIGDFYQQYMQNAIGREIPNFSQILQQGGVDTQATLAAALPLIQGQIPPDVARQVMERSAFTSLGAGSLGGPMGTAFSARQLGLTSLDLMNQGANLAASGGNAAQRWQQMAMGTIMPPSSQMYSPEWFSTFNAQQNAARQATQQMRFNVAAAPDPAWADRAKMFANLTGMAAGSGNLGGSIGSSYGASFGQGGAGGMAGGMGISGGMGQGAFGNFGGANPYTATTGGWNTPWGSNIGGSDIPYLGGNVGTPSGPSYGSGGSPMGSPAYLNQIGG
jgi:hypothetical protein